MKKNKGDRTTPYDERGEWNLERYHSENETSWTEGWQEWYLWDISLLDSNPRLYFEETTKKKEKNATIEFLQRRPTLGLS